MGSGNQCGIHIHAGTSCTEDALGHFWNSTLVPSDPWTSVQYDSADGQSQYAAGIEVLTGLGNADILGKAVVVHDSVAPGNRIACALITEAQTTTTTTTTGATLVATNFVKYFNSDTAFQVSGSVSFQPILSSAGLAGQSVTWDLADVDPACKTGSGNQCGIHIHAGTSCTEDALGHFWNSTLVPSDPWTSVQYDSADGQSQYAAGIEVLTGLGNADILGKAVVVHDS